MKILVKLEIPQSILNVIYMLVTGKTWTYENKSRVFKAALLSNRLAYYLDKHYRSNYSDLIFFLLFFCFSKALRHFK
ncbi:MAG: hypothetical protein LBH45_02370 [Campylobacteraceae bacterium]|nr:hypothetical protein [Campylobacteraceae bacterium]